jgi:hypothetical protein
MEKRSQAKKYLLDSSNGLIPDQQFICHWVSWKNGRKKTENILSTVKMRSAELQSIFYINP